MTTNQAPNRIQLTAEALNALFPAGSEARVELQAHCVREFAKQFVGKHVIDNDVRDFIRAELQPVKDKLEAQMERATQECVREVLNDRGFNQNSNRVYISQETTKAIKQKVEDQVQTLLDSEIRKSFDASVEQQVQNLADKGRWNREFVEHLEKTIRAKLTAKLLGD